MNDNYEGFGKFFEENGEYYIGQWSNCLMHGKGTKYYQDGNIKYDGDFVNDNYEGHGKGIWENGEYKLDNGWKVQDMEKEKNIIRMVILNMKVIL